MRFILDESHQKGSDYITSYQSCLLIQHYSCLCSDCTGFHTSKPRVERERERERDRPCSNHGPGEWCHGDLSGYSGKLALEDFAVVWRCPSCFPMLCNVQLVHYQHDINVAFAVLRS